MKECNARSGSVLASLPIALHTASIAEKMGCVWFGLVWCGVVWCAAAATQLGTRCVHGVDYR